VFVADGSQLTETNAASARALAAEDRSWKGATFLVAFGMSC